MLGFAGTALHDCINTGTHHGNDHFRLMDGVFFKTAAAAGGGHNIDICRGNSLADSGNFRTEPQSRAGEHFGTVLVGKSEHPFCRGLVRSKRLVDIHALAALEGEFGQHFVDFRIGGSQDENGIGLFHQFFQRGAGGGSEFSTPFFQRLQAFPLFRLPGVGQFKFVRPGSGLDPRRIIVRVPFINKKVNKTDLLFHFLFSLPTIVWEQGIMNTHLV